MKKLWYFVYFLGILSLISYFPILFFIGIYLPKYFSQGFLQFLTYFLMIFPIFLGGFLMGLANFKLYKIRVFEINQLVENSVQLESMKLEEISRLEYSKNKTNSQKSEQIRQEIIYILTNKNSPIQNLIFVSYQISDKLRTFNFLKKLHIENCLRVTIYPGDYTAFEYKSKQIE